MSGTENRFLRYTLLLIVLPVALPLYGQGNINDTVRIREVVISRNKTISENPGFKKVSFDTIALSDFSNSNLSELISHNSLVFIKSYGAGGQAAPSFRGTGASQTLIDWNGININSPMLGQADLSLIPVGLIDDIQIYYGAASMNLNSGGIGGAINLETKPVWKNETMTSLNTGAGSFGEYSGLIKLRTGNTKFQTVTKGFFRSAENDFKYLDKVSGAQHIWKTRTNNQSGQQGFMQELYFRNSVNTVSAKVWYQTSRRHLPPTLMTEDNKEKQSDESLRILVSDNLTKGKSSFFLAGAWLMTNMNYTNQLLSIDSRNLSHSLVVKAGSESQIADHTKLKIRLNNEITTINTNNYIKDVSRNTSQLDASLERACTDRFGMTLLLREIINQKSFLIPDFSTAFQYRLIDRKDYFLKASISRNSRIPTMNDLYWSFIGNPDLKNEYAFTYELTCEMKQRTSARMNFVTDLSIFRNSVKDYLQWHPGENSIWTVDNINKVNTQGFESSLSLDYKSGKFKSEFNAAYSFTRAITMVSNLSNDVSIGKQLIYVPENQFNSSVRITYGSFYSLWTVNSTGIRYISTDNNGFLPGYIINNVMAGIKLPTGDSSIDLNFNINNLFAADYQSVAGYPMPGRSYLIKFLFQIIK